MARIRVAPCHVTDRVSVNVWGESFVMTRAQASELASKLAECVRELEDVRELPPETRRSLGLAEQAGDR